eukprot:TRINITY_DN4848_c0_g1_i1.p1 TRINITY_DN4848_c0_g1~~TRINITY_DN4848_c0_g1_i1.p1  ORF type:complete len:130 (+),score=6.42 TRINITY_DN4848_c0_g1_i1:41-391(+)
MSGTCVADKCSKAVTESWTNYCEDCFHKNYFVTFQYGSASTNYSFKLVAATGSQADDSFFAAVGGGVDSVEFGSEFRQSIRGCVENRNYRLEIKGELLYIFISGKTWFMERIPKAT